MKRILVLAIALLAVQSLCAQESRSSFFVDNYVYSYRINPAATLEEKPFTHFSIGSGFWSVSAQSNISFSMLYTDILNSGVSWASLQPLLSGNNVFLPSVTVNLGSIGHQGKDWRIATEMNIRSVNSFSERHNFGYQLNNSAKDIILGRGGSVGLQNVHYSSSNYLEFAVCYAQKIGDYVTLGANAKLLLGLFGTGFDIYDLSIGGQPGEDLSVNVDADFFVSSSLIQPSTFEIWGQKYYDFRNTALGSLGLSGHGLAFDLGISVEPLDGLTLGLSVLDLGFLRWTKGFNGTLQYFGYLSQDLSDIFDVQVSHESRQYKMTNYNVHLSAKYVMPFCPELSLGALLSIQRYYNELRAGVTFTPFRFFSVSGNAAIGRFGPEVGAALNLRIPGFNLFVGANSFISSGYLSTITGGLTIAF